MRIASQNVRTGHQGCGGALGAPRGVNGPHAKSRPELDYATTGGSLPPQLAPGLYDFFKVPTLKMSRGIQRSIVFGMDMPERRGPNSLRLRIPFVQRWTLLPELLSRTGNVPYWGKISRHLVVRMLTA